MREVRGAAVLAVHLGAPVQHLAHALLLLRREPGHLRYLRPVHHPAQQHHLRITQHPRHLPRVDAAADTPQAADRELPGRLVPVVELELGLAQHEVGTRERQRGAARFHPALAPAHHDLLAVAYAVPRRLVFVDPRGLAVVLGHDRRAAGRHGEAEQPDDGVRHAVLRRVGAAALVRAEPQPRQRHAEHALGRVPLPRLPRARPQGLRAVPPPAEHLHGVHLVDCAHEVRDHRRRRVRVPPAPHPVLLVCRHDAAPPAHEPPGRGHHRALGGARLLVRPDVVPRHVAALPSLVQPRRHRQLLVLPLHVRVLLVLDPLVVLRRLDQALVAPAERGELPGGRLGDVIEDMLVPQQLLRPGRDLAVPALHGLLGLQDVLHALHGLLQHPVRARALGAALAVHDSYVEPGERVPLALRDQVVPAQRALEHRVRAHAERDVDVDVHGVVSHFRPLGHVVEPGPPQAERRPALLVLHLVPRQPLVALEVRRPHARDALVELLELLAQRGGVGDDEVMLHVQRSHVRDEVESHHGAGGVEDGEDELLLVGAGLDHGLQRAGLLQVPDPVQPLHLARASVFAGAASHWHRGGAHARGEGRGPA
mmetsp:Transcript_17289/g.59128  ORF Transcript_17289/g.59128 Transcript_17289/m.59128 type:complete len:595 (+) Transcript_17289:133-1917(+)